ncbi:MAG TPA: hypothetical protein VE860_21365 [Chthoniobacterales bacterium]|jgi:hypothetical protein|nr:hypothetical protein [Chthoniobacterales bacterium]
MLSERLWQKGVRQARDENLGPRNWDHQLNNLRLHAGDLNSALALGADVKKHVDQLDGAFLNAGIGSFPPFECAGSIVQAYRN